jgi:diguanylate cyclase (GGDEF)-like protein
MEFTETIDIFLVLSLLILVCALIGMFTNRSDSKVNKVVILSLVFMLSLVIINFSVWITNRTGQVGTTLTKIGLVIYMSISIALSINKIISNLIEANKAKELQRIAYTDSLTGLNNRYAFDRDIRLMDLSTMAIISLDINNLKYFNDNFGHDRGDTLIKESAKMLKNIFDTVYRTGGDEFIALKSGMTIEQLEKLRLDLVTETAKYNLDDRNDVIIEIACGFAVYTESDETYETIMIRSDSEMYRNKKKIKMHSKIRYTREAD